MRPVDTEAGQEQSLLTPSITPGEKRDRQERCGLQVTDMEEGVKAGDHSCPADFPTG